MADRNHQNATYKMAADEIIRYIKDNSLYSGDKLPSIRAFCDILQLGRHIVQNAMEELCYTGILEAKAKSGYFVSFEGWSRVFPNKVNWHKYKEKGLLSERCQGSGIFQETGIDSISRFSIGSHFNNTEVLANAMKKIAKKSNIFGVQDADYRGMYRLRKHLSQYMSTYMQNKVNPDEILITAGVFNSLTLIKLSLLRNGDTFFVDNCITPKDDSSFSSLGINKVHLPIDSEGIIPEKFKTYLKINKQSVLCSTFGSINPYAERIKEGISGTVRKTKILQTCNAAKIPIIELDQYRGILPDNAPPPLKDFDETDSVIYVNSFTKVFMNNFRVGWVAAPPDVIIKLANIRLTLAGNQNLLSQLAAIEMLESGSYENYLKSLTIKLTANREQSLEILERYLTGLASWNIYGNKMHIFIKFIPEINIRKMYENRHNYINFTPWFLMDKEYEQTIGICITKMTLDELRESIKKLVALARTSL